MPSGYYHRPASTGPEPDTYTPSEPCTDTYTLSCPIAATIANSWSIHDIDDNKSRLWHPNFGTSYDICRRSSVIFHTYTSKVKFDSYYD